MLRRAVFLDRDGTIIEDRNYLADPDGVRLLPGASRALRTFRERGRLLVLVSNQSGLARGLVGPEEHVRVHARVVALLAAESVVLDGAYYCEHGPEEGCACRKPAPGLLLAAGRDHAIDLTASLMIGDKPSDAAAGRAAGCTTALLAPGPGDADFQAPDWDALLTLLSPHLE